MTNALFLAATILLMSYSNIIVKLQATRLGNGSGKFNFVSYFWAMALDPLIWTAATAFFVGVPARVVWQQELTANLEELDRP